ncbi:hypothetical protein BC826DRAFT_1055656 [Russula brevipes]|nr:hypothetical protein BC826DRAFT_1055656 [Russula brevipes]
MVGAPPEFEFGNEEQHEPMNFTFDTIFTPGNDDMLAAMQAILNPAWSQTMMMPGSVFLPSGESMQGHNNFLGNGMAMNNYQNVQPQPEVLLG